MARELIKIQASYLRAGRPFAREIYLRLPKNQKMLRIVLPGDEIRAPLLARLLNSPGTEIFARPLDSDPADADALDIYGESEPAKGAVTDSTQDDFHPGNAAEEVKRLAATPPSGPESETLVEGSEGLLTSRRERSAEVEDDTETRIEADAPAGEFITTVSGSPALPAEEFILAASGLTAAPESSHQQFRGTVAAALTEAFAEVERQESAGTDISPALRALRDSLTRASEAVSGDASAEGPAELLREKLSECVSKIDACVESEGASTSGLLTAKGSLLQAIDALPVTSQGARAYRETPQIAARLATLLAHSLGYASPQYLYDVAFTTHLYFAEKNGTPLSPAEVPAMSLAISAKEAYEDQAGTPLGDSVAILQFLDRYFENPDCDRTQKEFGQRVFESTLIAMPTNEWTAARWRYFVGQGASLPALSACSKATAKVKKTVRTLTGVAASESESA